MRPRLYVLLPVLLALTVSTGAWPSEARGEEPGASQAVTMNTVFAAFGWFNAEYERTLTPASTWGASYSRFAPGGLSPGGYRGMKAVWRYYPRGMKAVWRTRHWRGDGSVFEPVAPVSGTGAPRTPSRWSDWRWGIPRRWAKANIS